MSDRQASDVHRPNGIPFVEMDESGISKFESGSYCLSFEREDYERFRANFTEDDLHALKKAIDWILEAEDE